MTQEFFDVEVARECGVNAAAVASYLWYRFREDPEMKYRHGAAWVGVSQKMMTYAMPYLSIDQVSYAVEKLKKKGYIRVGRYSSSKFDHTNWYSFTDYGASIMNFGESYEDEDD